MFCLCGLHRITTILIRIATILTNFQISVLTNINQYQPISIAIELGKMNDQPVYPPEMSLPNSR